MQQGRLVRTTGLRLLAISANLHGLRHLVTEIKGLCLHIIMSCTFFNLYSETMQPFLNQLGCIFKAAEPQKNFKSWLSAWSAFLAYLWNASLVCAYFVSFYFVTL